MQCGCAGGLSSETLSHLTPSAFHATFSSSTAHTTFTASTCLLLCLMQVTISDLCTQHGARHDIYLVRKNRAWYTVAPKKLRYLLRLRVPADLLDVPAS